MTKCREAANRKREDRLAYSQLRRGKYFLSLLDN